jgi:hypothetical protein
MSGLYEKMCKIKLGTCICIWGLGSLKEIVIITFMTTENSSQRQKYWKKTDENLLEEWADHGKSFRWMHEQSRVKFWKRNIQFQVPVIILSTLTGAANFAQERVPSEYQGYYAIIVGFFNIIAGIIATIQTFLKVSESLEGHRVASVAWGKYYHNVKTELQKEPEDREDVVDFMKYAKMEYEKLVEQSPPIPPEIVNRLKENVGKSEIHVHLPPNAGVFERIEIGKQGIRMVPESSIIQITQKEKSNMERVLNEIDNADNLPRTERKLSRAVSFAPMAHAQEEGNISLSNKLMSSFNAVIMETVQSDNNEKSEDSGVGIGDGKE